MIVTGRPRNLGVRSFNPQSVALQRTVTVPAVPGFGGVANDGLGAITDYIPDLSSGWIGYGLAGAAILYFMFGSSHARERREALGKAREDYRARVGEIRAKYRRF